MPHPDPTPPRRRPAPAIPPVLVPYGPDHPTFGRTGQSRPRRRTLHWVRIACSVLAWFALLAVVATAAPAGADDGTVIGAMRRSAPPLLTPTALERIEGLVAGVGLSLCVARMRRAWREA